MKTQKTEKTNVVTITTAVGECKFTIPDEFPKIIYLDVYVKSFKIFSDGSIEEII